MAPNPRPAIPNSSPGLKLREICSRLRVDYDAARYTLAQGVLPPGIAADPGKGNHRVFDASQAFTLAIVLKLKTAGVTTAAARQLADWSRQVQRMAQNLGWDWQFAPFAGKLRTEKDWYVDVGDGRLLRVVTNAAPSGGLTETPWTDMTTRKESPEAQPSIVFRVDIAQIARQLADAAPSV